MRLDQWLTEQGLYRSRSRAQQAIEAGAVRINGQTAKKASTPVSEDDQIEADADALKYVSRGGHKLEKAIKTFGLDFSQKTVLDVGASTGGFTDCALQHGASKVIALDIGNNQLAPSLRTHTAVVNMEDTDIRETALEDIGQPVDWIVVDASFISLRHIFPVLPALLKPEGRLVVLVKPQFEQIKRMRFRGGVIRDEHIQQHTLEQVQENARDCGLVVCNICPTDAEPGKNQEYLLEMRLNTAE